MSKYTITIIWQSIKNYEVEAESLQEAVAIATKEFLAEPDDNYQNIILTTKDISMNKTFKVGDWVFCEFVLQQIKEMNGDKVTGVEDGNFSMSYSDLNDRCFHLSLPIKRISDAVNYWSKKLHEIKNNSVNHPDLNRELIRRWAVMCQNSEDENAAKAGLESLRKFCENVVSMFDGLADMRVDGIPLIRR